MEFNENNQGANEPAGRTGSFASPAAQEGVEAAKNPARLNVAVYARYSDDAQKVTSIEDQIRTCAETAKRHGLVVSKSLIFADDAITGASKATHKREQYHAMRKAVRAGQVDVILCDQQCRLARSAKESLTFFDELKDNNVRLLTADGFDSRQATAQLLFGIKSVFSEFFLDETRHRVRRGMVGEFGRGSMVTAIPYGYRIDPVRTAETGRCQWTLDPQACEVVKEIFRCRKDGMSLNQIAAVLNVRRVAPPRPGNNPEGKYWRSSAIWRMLQNATYKGIYAVDFGSDENGKRQYGQRVIEELALVSPEDWMACQAKGKGSTPTSATGTTQHGSRGRYGGGKHPLAGVFGCGTCGAMLSCHHAKADGGSLYCVQCEHAKTAGLAGRQALYISVKGVRLMLQCLLQKVVSGEALSRYQELLRQRLAGGREEELAKTRQDLEKAERAQLRLSRLLQQISADDPVLEQQYLKTREEVLVLARKVAEADQGLRDLNQDSIRKQLNIDLSEIVDVFLADGNAPERTRALLNRIFPSIILQGKTDRYTAIFEVHVKPGAILAEASGTVELVDGNEVIWLRLNTSGSKNPVWTVEEIPAPHGGKDRGTVDNLT